MDRLVVPEDDENEHEPNAWEDERRMAVVHEVISLQRALEGPLSFSRLLSPLPIPSQRRSVLSAGFVSMAAPICAHARLLPPSSAEINIKVANTRAENHSLMQENENLSEYIDSLMTNISGMGALITTDNSTPSLRNRLLHSGRKRTVRVNAHVGELKRADSVLRSRPGYHADVSFLQASSDNSVAAP
ncbi:MAG: hypothetical protein SGPRY_012499 [Prymnesium sp.]